MEQLIVCIFASIGKKDTYNRQVKAARVDPTVTNVMDEIRIHDPKFWRTLLHIDRETSTLTFVGRDHGFDTNTNALAYTLYRP